MLCECTISLERVVRSGRFGGNIAILKAIMLSISRSTVPVYLQNSEFYLALSGDDDCEIEIPEDCFKRDTTVCDEQSLSHLLCTLRFWGVSEVFGDVYQASQDPREYFDTVVENFSNEFPYLAVLRDLRKSRRKLLKDKVEFAVNANSIEVFKLLQKKPIKDVVVQRQLFVLAAICGHLEFLQYFHALKYVWTSAVCESAASNGRLNCLKYLHEQGCPWDVKTIANFAVVGGVTCLQYVADSGCTLGSNLYGDAARVDCAVRCEFLYLRGVRWDSYFPTYATIMNAQACLRFILTHGCDFSAVLIHERCNVELLQLVHELGCLTPAQAAEQTSFAANTGDLEKFAYIHSLNLRVKPSGNKKRLPLFDAKTAEACLYYKENTQCFEYMVQYGYKITMLDVQCAHLRDNVLAMRYMHSQGFDVSTINLHQAEEIIGRTSTAMMKCLCECGYKCTEKNLSDAVIKNDVNTVMYLIDSGCPVPPDICRMAGTYHSKDVLVYLHEEKGYTLQSIIRNEWNGDCADYINQRLSVTARFA